MKYSFKKSFVVNLQHLPPREIQSKYKRFYGKTIALSYVYHVLQTLKS